MMIFRWRYSPVHAPAILLGVAFGGLLLLFGGYIGVLGLLTWAGKGKIRCGQEHVATFAIYEVWLRLLELLLQRLGFLGGNVCGVLTYFPTILLFRPRCATVNHFISQPNECLLECRTLGAKDDADRFAF